MTDLAPPVLFVWDGEVMRPGSAIACDLARRTYKTERIYSLAEVGHRSSQSHRHYFAAINEAWVNLPEKYKEEWWAKSPETLRKHALIEEDFCDIFSFVFDSVENALAAALELRRKDQGSEVHIRENGKRSRVMWYTAWSQAEGKMDKATFQRSKTAVLDYLANLLGVPKEELIERGKAA